MVPQFLEALPIMKMILAYDLSFDREILFSTYEPDIFNTINQSLDFFYKYSERMGPNEGSCFKCLSDLHFSSDIKVSRWVPA